MRAVIITQPGGPEVLALQTVETPEPFGEWVRVRVRAAGINRADIAQRLGFYPAPEGVPAVIPGMEFAGEVDAVGPLVRRWRPGQRVMGIVGGGAQAEYVVIHEGMLVEIPENLDFVQAAAVPEVFMTAHDALFTQGELHMGERLLVHAAGSGVGTAAIQLAHAAGATVYGTSRTVSKLERAKPLGLAVGLSDKTFATDIRRLTAGAGVHLILDFVGAPYMEQNLESLTDWGRLVFLATMGGNDAQVDLRLLMGKRIQMRGCTLRSRTLEEKLTVTRLFATQVVPLLANATVYPIVEEVFAMQDIAQAHNVMAENRNFGKLILRID
jgi:putative NAD(P)H quinone oxidoreductase, PIG3 family